MAAGGGDKKSGIQKVGDPIQNTGEARSIAAKAVGANHTYVSEAKRLTREAPDVAETASRLRKFTTGIVTDLIQ